MVINTLLETKSLSLEIQNYQIFYPTIDSPLSGELLIPYSVFKSVEGLEWLQLSSSPITKCPLYNGSRVTLTTTTPNQTQFSLVKNLGVLLSQSVSDSSLSQRPLKLQFSQVTSLVSFNFRILHDPSSDLDAQLLACTFLQHALPFQGFEFVWLNVWSFSIISCDYCVYFFFLEISDFMTSLHGVKYKCLLLELSNDRLHRREKWKEFCGHRTE